MKEAHQLFGVFKVLIEIELRHPLKIIEVCTRTKGFPLSRKDNDFNLTLLRGVQQRLRQLADEKIIEGVSFVRAYQGDKTYPVVHRIRKAGKIHTMRWIVNIRCCMKIEKLTPRSNAKGDPLRSPVIPSKRSLGKEKPHGEEYSAARLLDEKNEVRSNVEVELELVRMRTECHRFDFFGHLVVDPSIDDVFREDIAF